MAKRQIQINHTNETVEVESSIQTDTLKAELQAAIDTATQAESHAEAAYQAAKAAWNEVFFLIKGIKPLMKTSRALAESKLGVLLNKLP